MTDLPSPDRLARARRYALLRSAELVAQDRVAAELRAELPDLTPDAAGRIATRLIAAIEDRLADALAARPDVAARSVVAFAFGDVA